LGSDLIGIGLGMNVINRNSMRNATLPPLIAGSNPWRKLYETGLKRKSVA